MSMQKKSGHLDSEGVSAAGSLLLVFTLKLF
jgi:hypothetical protein